MRGTLVDVFKPRAQVVVPAFGQDHLTDTVVADLLRDGGDEPVVVVDNRGDYTPAVSDPRLTVHRPGVNLKWIGTVNWALDTAEASGTDVVVVLNNDTRLSRGYLAALLRTFEDQDDVAVAAGVYDDFWLHERATVIPASADAYVPVAAYRDVPFCDGTGIAFSVTAAKAIGRLDTVAFPEHGYGADLDYAIRAHRAGYRCVVTESAYLSHLRRGTMDGIAEETGERHRHEILTGLDGLYGPDWRPLVGLGPGAFPAHNTGSSASWYA
ncbi:glycosyltransferase [Jatrophihabitans sp. YIM 134969]